MFFARLGMLLIVLGLLMTCSDGVPGEPPRAQIKITEWLVPWEDSRPRDPYYESAEKVWFVGQVSGYLAYFNTLTEEFAQLPLAEGSGPHNIIVDDQGNAWFAGNLNGYIGKVTPAGAITQITMPEEIYDPHTLIDDGKGTIWFTAQGANYVGSLDKRSLDKQNLSKTFFAVQTPSARPYGITIAPDGKVWVALFGTNKLAVVDPEIMELAEVDLPRPGARPRRIAATSDGMVWYVDYAEGFLGRYNPDMKDFKEWAMPSGSSAKPYGMAADAKDRIWFVEVGPQPNKFIGFDPKDESFFSITEIESGGGAVRHMMYHAATNTIWFATDANTLGRAELPD